MARLPIRTVELGYANKPKSGYYGKYNFLLAGTTISAKSRLRADQQLALMFDEKSIAPEDVRTLLAPHVGTVDLVRIAVAPARADRALSLADEIRSLGIKVGINVMYLSDYWDDVDNSAWVNSIEGRVDSLALVDSYGACLPRQVATAVEGVLKRVGSTPVGFHGHDNLGLALANSIAAAESGASIVDGTVTGMGRGPGNTRTELLLVHKAKGELDSLDHVAIESVTEQFQTLQAEHGWGTNLVYMISGAAGLPQNDVMDWLGKNRYSISAIVDALQGHANTSLDAEAYPPLQSP
jgi:4-hydroxy 2-oxovalerate aldolase